MNSVHVTEDSIYIVDGGFTGVFLNDHVVRVGKEIKAHNVATWGQRSNEAVCTLPELHAALLLLKEKKDETPKINVAGTVTGRW